MHIFSSIFFKLKEDGLKVLIDKTSAISSGVPCGTLNHGFAWRYLGLMIPNMWSSGQQQQQHLGID